MPISYTALKSEFVSNPVAMAYLPFIAANDEANANIINNLNGNAFRTVNRDSISSADFLAQTTYAAFDGLTASEEAWYRTIATAPSIVVSADTLSTWAGVPTPNSSLWPAASKTQMEARIKALMQYQGSRAQEIRATLGASSVTPSDVANARAV